MVSLYIGPDEEKKDRDFFYRLSINLNICFGAQKNRLIETVYLSTHNICFDSEMRKLFLNAFVLSKCLFVT